MSGGLRTTLVLTLLSAAALAEDPKLRARTLFKEGEAAYQAGRYDEAIRDYNEAFALVPMPLLVFDLAQAYRLKGERDKAIESYRKYLYVDANGRGAPEARQQLAALEKEAEEASKAAEARKPAEEAARAQAAREAEEAKAREQRAREEESRRAQPQVVAPAPRPPDHPKSKKWIWGVVGGAAVLVGVGLGVGLGLGLSKTDYPRADATISTGIP